MFKGVIVLSAIIEFVFAGVGWFLFVTFAGVSYSLLFFVMGIVLGAFLGGLLAGFLARSRKVGALSGFGGALIGTSVAAVTIGFAIISPPGPLIFVGFAWLDLAGLAGGALGVRLNRKVLSAAFFGGMVTLALLATPAVSSMPVEHDGTLVLLDNDKMVITGRVCQQTGNVIVQDNASLTIVDSEFDLVQNGQNYSIEVKDQGSLVVDGASMFVLTKSQGATNSLSVIQLWDNASALFSRSRVVPFDVEAFNSSTVRITDSLFTYGQVVAHDEAAVSVVNSTVPVTHQR